jgi:hypothetical protein
VKHKERGWHLLRLRQLRTAPTSLRRRRRCQPTVEEEEEGA